MINFSKYKLQTYLTEADMKNAPSIKDAKPPKKTNVKRYKGLGYAPTIKSEQYFKDLRTQKEFARKLEENKVNWREELQEKVMDGQERENHPYVTVMPTGDENLIQAIKQMAGAAKQKKAEMMGGGQMKEELILEKKCKKCEKKKKDCECHKSGRYGYRYEPEEDNDDGDGGGTLGGDGGGGESFLDFMGDMLLKEKELSIADQMKISKNFNRMSPKDKKKSVQKALGNPKKAKPKKDTRSDAQKMADAYASPRKGPGGATRAD